MIYIKCILLCAGYATRLFPLTENFPKALLDIEEGKPLLNYIVDEINKIEEIDQIYIISNDRYYNHFKVWSDSLNNIKNIKVINDHTTSNDDRLGAIGDIAYVLNYEHIDDDLLIIAGDNLFDYSLSGVIDYYKEKDGAVVCTKKINNYELLKHLAVASIDNNNRITELVEKPNEPKTDIAVYATYVYPKSVIGLIKEYLETGNNPDAPGHLVQYLYKIMPVYAYCFDGNCYDVGTYESLEEVRKIYRGEK